MPSGSKAALSPACPADGDHAALRQWGMAAGSAEPVTAAAKGLEVATLSPKGFLDSSPPALCKCGYANLETLCCFHAQFLYILQGFCSLQFR